MVPKNPHAAGQCSVPAGTNNSAPMTTIQIKVCSNSFAIMRRSRSDSAMIARFSGKLATCIPPWSLPGLTRQSIFFVKSAHAKMDGYAGQARV